MRLSSNLWVEKGASEQFSLSSWIFPKMIISSDFQFIQSRNSLISSRCLFRKFSFFCSLCFRYRKKVTDNLDCVKKWAKVWMTQRVFDTIETPAVNSILGSDIRTRFDADCNRIFSTELEHSELWQENLSTFHWFCGGTIHENNKDLSIICSNRRWYIIWRIIKIRKLRARDFKTAEPESEDRKYRNPENQNPENQNPVNQKTSSGKAVSQKSSESKIQSQSTVSHWRATDLKEKILKLQRFVQ